MNNWLMDAQANYQSKGHSIDDFFMKKINIIDENNVILDIIGYFNVDKLE
jgi:hypothetical protein